MEDANYGDIWRAALDDQLPVLQKNLLMNEYFYAHLIQKRIFMQDTIDVIKSEVSSDARILSLVGYLKKRPNQCFDDFMSILEATDNRFIKEIIDEAIAKQRLRRLREDAKSSELLKQKDRQIRELEQELSDLAMKFSEADQMARKEMQRSKHYLEVINNLTSVRPHTTPSISIDDRDLELEDMSAEMESLQEQVESLETELQKASQEIDKTKRQLSFVTESERKIKRNLGLQEDADETEVSSRIQELRRSQTELKTTQAELERINEKKDEYVEKIRKLKKEMTRMDGDRRRKDLQLQRLTRDREDNEILKNARSILDKNKRSSHPTELLNLPIIDIGQGRLPSARNRGINWKLFQSTDLSTQPQFHETVPNSTFRGTRRISNELRDLRYCVLCRSETDVREACRIHTGAKRDGQYTCCKSAENGVRSMGCRILHSHLYVKVTGVDSECRFYDQHGRLFCLRDSDGVDQMMTTSLLRSQR